MRTKLPAIGAIFLALAVYPMVARAGEAAADSNTFHPELLGPNYSQIIWVLFIFILLVVVLYRTAWKNVLAGLTARELRIRTDIAEAEAARHKAEESLAQYNKQLADAEVRVRDLLDKNDAIAQIYEQTAVLATSVAEKILRRSLNPDDQRDLVTRSLDQLQSLRNN